MLLELSVVIGVTFGLIAGAMAFLITYDEYAKHRLRRRRLWQESIRSGLVAFTFFVVTSIVAGHLLARAF